MECWFSDKGCIELTYKNTALVQIRLLGTHGRMRRVCRLYRLFFVYKLKRKNRDDVFFLCKYECFYLPVLWYMYVIFRSH